MGSLVDLPQCGSDLIAIGEAWDGIDQILAGEPVVINVGISVGFRRGDRDSQEGLFACLRIDWEEIVLDELHTTYESGIGSDRSTTNHATLRPTGRFDATGAQRWIELLNELRSDEDSKLSTERDHV